MENMSIYEKLCKIQTELKAPKGQRNNFGKYNYRSCEDILEALKPLLDKYEATINLSDNIVQVGERYYVSVVAKLTDAKTGESVMSTAFAREDESKKGMDASQLTGATSSYARKYALNGLLAIDDTKDSDYLNNGSKVPNNDEKHYSKSTITLDMAKDIEVSFGEYKGKTLWQVAEKDLDTIKEWYQKASGDRKDALKLILDEKR
nr:MAG TPA: ERF superfamily protein [Caudoviricetes sp.]